MTVGILTLHLHLPACTSLKEKRGRIKPILARLHREFNVAAAETGLQDRWNEAILAAAALANETVQVERVLQEVAEYASHHFPDVEVFDQKIELIPGV